MARKESQTIFSLIDQYSAVLGLGWSKQISRVVIDRPTILTNPVTKRHVIHIPQDRGLKVFEAELVHELVHAHFSEHIDPILSTAVFHPNFWGNEPGIVQFREFIGVIQSAADVWVSDTMRSIRPALVIHDIQSSLDGYMRQPPENLRAMSYSAPLICGINYADIRRGNFKQFRRKETAVLRRIGDILGPEISNLSITLGQHYESLPLLPTAREPAVRAYEHAVQVTAEVLGYPALPVLVHMEADDRHVWAAIEKPDENS